MKIVAKWLAIAGLALAIVLGGQALSTTFAQSTSTTQTHAPALKPKGHKAERRFVTILIKKTAELSKLTHGQVVSELKTGQSLTDIAVAHGSTEQAVIDAALAELETRLDTAISNGKISETQKTQALDKARANAPTLMNDKNLKQHKPDKPNKRGQQHLIQATAEVTGLTVEQVRAELATGKTLEQVAQDHGKTADDIIANLRTKGEAKLNEMLDQAREEITK